MSSSMILTTVFVLLATFIGCTLSDGSFVWQNGENNLSVCAGTAVSFFWRYNGTNGDTMRSITWTWTTNSSDTMIANSIQGHFITDNPRITYNTTGEIKIANVTKADEGTYNVSGFSVSGHNINDYSADKAVTLHVKDSASLKDGKLDLNYEYNYKAVNKTVVLKCGPFSSVGDTSVTWTIPDGTTYNSTESDAGYFIYTLTEVKEGNYICTVNYVPGSCSNQNGTASLHLNWNQVKFDSIESRLDSLEEKVGKLHPGNGTTDSLLSTNDLQELQETLSVVVQENIFMNNSLQALNYTLTQIMSTQKP